MTYKCFRCNLTFNDKSTSKFIEEESKMRLEIVIHPLRESFSCRCTKSQHSLCNGRVRKSRSPDGICKCPCHIEVDER